MCLILEFGPHLLQKLQMKIIQTLKDFTMMFGKSCKPGSILQLQSPNLQSLQEFGLQ